MAPMSERPTRALIAGGGVAGLELMLALRALAGERVEIDLLSTEREFVYRPLAVAEPFDVGKAHRFDLASIARDRGARVLAGALAGVDAEQRHALTADGGELSFDVLAIAVGARPREALMGALTFPGEEQPQLPWSAQRARRRRGRAAGVRCPSGLAWSLPLYELALMTATFAAARGLDGLEITLVTPEDAPLGLFGRRASNAVRALLEERGIAVRTGAQPTLVQGDRLVVTPGEPVPADCVVALPVLEGPRLPGLPHDPGGFIPDRLLRARRGGHRRLRRRRRDDLPGQAGRHRHAAGGRGRPVNRRARRRPGQPGAVPAGAPRPAPHREHARLPPGRGQRRQG